MSYLSELNTPIEGHFCRYKHARFIWSLSRLPHTPLLSTSSFSLFPSLHPLFRFPLLSPFYFFSSLHPFFLSSSRYSYSLSFSVFHLQSLFLLPSTPPLSRKVLTCTPCPWFGVKFQDLGLYSIYWKVHNLCAESDSYPCVNSCCEHLNLNCQLQNIAVVS